MIPYWFAYALGLAILVIVVWGLFVSFHLVTISSLWS
jgi:hypothetical protein